MELAKSSISIASGRSKFFRIVPGFALEAKAVKGLTISKIFPKGLKNALSSETINPHLILIKFKFFKEERYSSASYLALK